jgi:hypothetical protein
MTRAPARTCLGCRRVRAKTALIRLVRGADGVVATDLGGAAPGRGAYVCPEEACVARALQRGRLTHAFRTSSEASSGLAREVRGLCQQ